MNRPLYKRGEKQVEFLSSDSECHDTKRYRTCLRAGMTLKDRWRVSQECKCAVITMGFLFPGEYNVTVSFFIFINTSHSVSVITILN